MVYKKEVSSELNIKRLTVDVLTLKIILAKSYFSSKSRTKIPYEECQ
jgi:hypothetical protein